MQVDVDYETLENDFAVLTQPPRSKGGLSSHKRSAPTVTIIDGKRAQNIAIRLSKFKGDSHAQLVARLVRMTTTGEIDMDEDMLEAVVGTFPSDVSLLLLIIAGRGLDGVRHVLPAGV